MIANTTDLYKINFRNYEGYVIKDRALYNKNISLRDDLYYYHLRCSDNDISEPFTLEDIVSCNYWGTICFKEPIDHLLTRDFYGTGDLDKLGTDLTEEERDNFWHITSDYYLEENEHLMVSYLDI